MYIIVSTCTSTVPLTGNLTHACVRHVGDTRGTRVAHDTRVPRARNRNVRSVYFTARLSLCSCQRVVLWLL